MGIEQIGRVSASYLGVPIPSGGEVAGVISVQSTDEEGRFTEADQRLLSTIASAVGVPFTTQNSSKKRAWLELRRKKLMRRRVRFFRP